MLLTAGCSFVYGDELDGCENDPPTHWPLTFTHQLAELQELEYKNLGWCGNGNQKILRDVVTYLQDHDDVSHMVVLWSAWNREEFAEILTPEQEEKFRLKRQQQMSQVSVERSHDLQKPLSGAVGKLFSQEGYRRSNLMRGINCMTTLSVLCKARGIKLIQGIFHDRMWHSFLSYYKDRRYKEFNDYIKNALDKLPHNEKVGMFGCYEDLFSLSKKKYGLKPNAHPVEEAHAEYAKLLNHIFNGLK